jgi:7-carboxy-7-deazaguanine synthase
VNNVVALASHRAGPDPALVICETFVSLQGEGPLTGQHAAFVRFAHCNLTCRWCDTEYAWNWAKFHPEQETRRGPVTEIASWVREQDVDLVVVTGGEPLLQRPALARLADLCAPARIQVETNGTRIPDPAVTAAVDLFVVSPKLAHSGVPQGQRLIPEALRALTATGRVAWKFVVTRRSDLNEIAALVDGFDLVGPVWVMPEGRTVRQVLGRARRLAAPVIERGWNLSLRQQTLLWGDLRGR